MNDFGNFLVTDTCQRMIRKVTEVLSDMLLLLFFELLLFDLLCSSSNDLVSILFYNFFY